jgi:hypothetical protein
MPRRKRPKYPEELTPKEEKFVEARSDPERAGLSLTAAALDAGYSPKLVRAVASRVGKRPRVIKAIELRKKYLAEMADVRAADVLGATARIAFGSIVDALDADGNFDFRKAKHTGAADLIKKITKKPGEYGTAITVEFYPKDAALARLGNYLGLETEARPNPKKAALQLLDTIRRVQNLSLRDAIVALLRMQQERQVTLVPPELLLELARDNGITEISVE